MYSHYNCFHFPFSKGNLVVMSLLFVLLCGCANDDSEVVIDDEILLSSFSLMKDNNEALTNDVYAEIKDSTVTVLCPHLQSVESLIPTFEGSFDNALVGGAKIQSGVSSLDFTKMIRLQLTKNNNQRFYNIIVKAQNCVPRIDILTDNSAEITSKVDYIPATIVISNNPEYGNGEYRCKIRGRGNSSWTRPKKPYKVKLDAKTSIFGFPANKDWVLLAEYCDKSLLRTAYMCEMSKAVEKEYTVNYKHVDLYLNGDYNGTYILTDLVEKADNRVNISKDGFIIEDDNFYNYEPLYFTTDSMGFNYTFKYPNADKAQIVSNDDNYNYISSYMNQLENALLKLDKDPQDVSYTELIDTESFAKWYLIWEVLGNWEPNLYFVLPSRTAKMQMGPAWDAEWSLGLAANGNPDNPWGWYAYPHEAHYNDEIWREKKYYKYLMKSPIFRQEVNTLLNRYMQNILSINVRIEKVKTEITFTQDANFKRWDVLNELVGAGLFALGSWEAEVDYASDIFNKRLQWVYDYLQ